MSRVFQQKVTRYCVIFEMIPCQSEKCLEPHNHLWGRIGIHLRVPHFPDVVVDLILHSIARVIQRISMSSNDIWTASEKGDLEALSALIAAKADVNVNGGWNEPWTPLHYAADGGHSLVLQALIDARANVDGTDASQWTPLYYAVQGGHTAAVQVLIDANATINVNDEYGMTPLHSAACNGHTEAVQVLLAARADVTLRDYDGKTALELAEEEGHTDTAQVLRDAAAIKENA